MTISFPWWALPIACVAAGMICATFFGARDRGGYDYFTPMLVIGSVMVGVATAIGIVVGKLVLG